MACNVSIGSMMYRASLRRQGALTRGGGLRIRPSGWKLLLAVGLLLQTIGFAAWAADTQSRESASRGLFADTETPIEITADSMELQRKTNTIIYKGNVLVVRDDVKITSDVLSARYDAKDGGLRSVVAEGTVRVRDGGREMTGDKAVFDGPEETITVSGNTTVRDGNNSISGDRVTIYVKEDRILVENSGGRVRAVVFPGQLNR